MRFFSLNLVAYASGSGIGQYELLGSLQPDVSFNTTTGELAGRPSRGGTYALAVRCLGTCGWSNYAPFNFIVEGETTAPPSSGSS